MSTHVEHAILSYYGDKRINKDGKILGVSCVWCLFRTVQALPHRLAFCWFAHSPLKCIKPANNSCMCRSHIFDLPKLLDGLQ